MFKKLKVYFGKSHIPRGLTLIEVLVTASLIIFMSTLVIRNVSQSRIDLVAVANTVASDIRLAQQLALSSHQYQKLCDPADTGCVSDPAPRNRCGYGIAPNPANTNGSYIIYAGPPTVKADGTSNNCAGSRQYQVSQDVPTYKTVILDTRLNFRDNPGQGQLFQDIYFEPPSSIVYFQNTLQDIDEWQQIKIKKVGVGIQGGPPGTSCSNGNPNCIYICVYGSGRVEVVKTYNVCP